MIHCIPSRFKLDCKDLIPESLEPRTDSDKLADLLVDGVLIDDVNADQVEILERTLIHE